MSFRKPRLQPLRSSSAPSCLCPCLSHGQSSAPGWMSPCATDVSEPSPGAVGRVPAARLAPFLMLNADARSWTVYMGV